MVAGDAVTADGLKAQYFDNPDFTGLIRTQVDPTVNFNWAASSPTGVGVDTFSARWTGKVKAPISGPVTFTITSDDGSRLYVGGSLIIDNWRNQAAFAQSAVVSNMVAGQWYDLQLDYYENTGSASVNLKWAYGTQTSTVIPQTNLTSLATLGSPWVSGKMAEATLTVGGGAWPVHFVSIDVLGDARPAWYFTMNDARGTWTYPVGPLVGNGPQQVTAIVRDERGCEASLTVPVLVKVP